MLVLAGEVDDLGDLGLGDFIAEDAADADAALVDAEHHTCRVLDVHAEEALEDEDDELHRRIVVVEHQHLVGRSEEHTSELQSLMRISYAVFCLKKKKTISHITSIPKN